MDSNDPLRLALHEQLEHDPPSLVARAFGEELAWRRRRAPTKDLAVWSKARQIVAKAQHELEAIGL